MATWTQFTADAPRIAEIFTRRHAATGKLCMLATLRADGFPRISPMEPQIFAGRLLLIGMPGTRKFEDLRRDPRLSLHTATVDTQVADGDAKLWGEARDVPDPALFEQFAESLFVESGMDLRGQAFDHFYEVDIFGASSVEVIGERLDVTVWKPGASERVIEKH
ncbi:pyridoxamine 5'-phosphate oxidase family protein [Tomitella biformata]|uniref:pyridoxamine 5'-phosphate oxidase family protein n=1 Tax=Tomitella biformata TaxID=630403 RepID=UPI0004669179|nr:pyridoxamine 5'-phosphate oxidase family protein [Tomitella biformata]